MQQGDGFGDAEGDVEVLDGQADLGFGFDQEFGAAFGGGFGFQCQEGGVNLLRRAEALRGAAKPRLPGGVAGVGEAGV